MPEQGKVLDRTKHAYSGNSGMINSIWAVNGVAFFHEDLICKLCIFDSKDNLILTLFSNIFLTHVRQPAGIKFRYKTQKIHYVD